MTHNRLIPKLRAGCSSHPGGTIHDSKLVYVDLNEAGDGWTRPADATDDALGQLTDTANDYAGQWFRLHGQPLRPVAFPPGRARLATTPAPTGSPTVVKTIGWSWWPPFAACAVRVPNPAISTSGPGSNEFHGHCRQPLGTLLPGRVLKVTFLPCCSSTRGAVPPAPLSTWCPLRE